MFNEHIAMAASPDVDRLGLRDSPILAIDLATANHTVQPKFRCSA